MEPLTAAIQNIVNGGGGNSGIYRVKVPEGMSLAKFTKKSGYLGSSLKENGQVGGQAVLKPLLFDPTMLFMAGALMSIDKKLDKIQEMQQEILDFLIQKERSELKGDLNFLADILGNYKYNWDKDKYKNSNHIKILNIRQAAERKIDFYREQIMKKINKKSYIQTGQLVKRQLEGIQSEFKDYQLALYLYAFSSFLEVMLLENFDLEYLDRISNAPIFKKSQFDEKLIGAGDKLGEFGLQRIDNTMKQFVEKHSGYVHTFVENINEVNRLYNQPIEFIFDQDNIYLGVTEI